MKFLTLLKGGEQSLGVKTESGIVDVAAVVSETSDNNIPTTIEELIEGGESSINLLESLLRMNLSENHLLNEEDVSLGPSVPNPNKIICVGLNYAKHAEESNVPVPTEPILFNKFNNALIGHKGIIPIPKVTKQVDYEAELAIVIGKEVKEVEKKNALDYVFGYTIANDVSARDLQFRSSQWLLGKSSDGFCPVGPYIVSADEVGDPNNLNISLKVNGEVRQNSNTADMIFYCDEIVSYTSQFMTLEPGDIILTGTPEGVILGYPEEERDFLKAGDQISIEIEKLGVLENRLA